MNFVFFWGIRVILKFGIVIGCYEELRLVCMYFCLLC